MWELVTICTIHVATGVVKLYSHYTNQLFEPYWTSEDPVLLQWPISETSPMWRRGCKWVRELGERSGHLDEKNRECQFVDIDCSNACGGHIQRRELPTHLDQACPKRPYVCDYCPFEATFDVVTTQHWLVCGYFPLLCPNKCDVGRVERQNLEQHLKECSLQEVECDFSYAGCQTKLHREDFARHMEENMQNHIKIMQEKLKEVAAEIKKKFLQEENEVQQANVDLQRKMKELQVQKDCQIAEVKEALQQKDQQLADIAAQMQEKDGRISRLEATLKQKLGEPTRNHLGWWLFEFTMPGYRKVGAKWWKDAPCFYTHYGGYRLQVVTLADSVYGGMSVHVCVKTGAFDDQLQWPLKATVSLQLIDPSGGYQPYEQSMQGEGKKGPGNDMCRWHPFITHAELKKYIHNDSLCFRVVSVNLD